MLPRQTFLADAMPLVAALNEALSCFEILRSFGFSAQDIFFETVKLTGQETGIRTVIKVRNGDDFVIDLGVVKESKDAVLATWKEAVIEHNARDNEKQGNWIRDVFCKSRTRTRVVDLLVALEKRHLLPTQEKAK